MHDKGSPLQWHSLGLNAKQKGVEPTRLHLGDKTHIAWRYNRG